MAWNYLYPSAQQHLPSESSQKTSLRFYWPFPVLPLTTACLQISCVQFDTIYYLPKAWAFINNRNTLLASSQNNPRRRVTAIESPSRRCGVLNGSKKSRPSDSSGSCESDRTDQPEITYLRQLGIHQKLVIAHCQFTSAVHRTLTLFAEIRRDLNKYLMPDEVGCGLSKFTKIRQCQSCHKSQIFAGLLPDFNRIAGNSALAIL